MIEELQRALELYKQVHDESMVEEIKYEIHSNNDTVGKFWEYCYANLPAISVKVEAMQREIAALREFVRGARPFLLEVYEDNLQAGHLYPHQTRDVVSLLQRAEQLLNRSEGE